MKRMSEILLFGTLAVLLAGCAGTQRVQGPINPTAAAPGEKLIWSSHEKRPGWTISEPESEGDALVFVGLSGKHALERDARDDALRTATKNVIRYIGTLVQDKFNRLQTSYGLTSEIMDPTNVTRSMEEQLASAFASRVKAKEWYIEKWMNKKTKETYVISFVWAKVPKSVVKQVYEELCDNSIEDLKKKRDAANDAKAKAQFENAMKAFEEAKKRGFSLDE